jgi:hypothetical protein
MKAPKARVAVVAVVAAVLGATLLKMLCNAAFDFRVPGVTEASWSARESAENGLLVCRLQVAPKTFPWEGQTVTVDEAWIEEAAERKYRLGWFPYYQRTGQCHLCLSRHGGGEELVGPDAPSFHLLGHGESFCGMVSRGRAVDWVVFESPDGWPRRIHVGSNFGGRDRLELTLRITSPE